MKIISFLKLNTIKNKLLLIYLLVSIVPLCILGTYSYSTIIKTMQTKMQQDAIVELKNTDIYIIEKNATLQKIVDSIAFDTQLMKQIVGLNAGEEILESVKESVVQKTSSTSGVKGVVFVPTDTTKYFHYNNGTYDTIDIVKFMVEYGNVSDTMLTWYRIDEKSESSVVVGSSIQYENRIVAKIYFVLDEGILGEILPSKEDGTNLIVLDGSDKIFLASGENYNEMWGDTLKYSDSLFSQNENSIIAKIADKKVVVAYYKSAITDWSFIEYINYDIFNKAINSIMGTTILLIILIIIFLILVYFIIIKSIIKPLNIISHSLENLDEDNLHKPLVYDNDDEIGTIVKSYNKMVNNIKNMITDMVEKEREQRELEMLVLRYQINPHFMYNVLTTIRFMALTAKQPKIAEAVHSLDLFLRNSVKFNCTENTLANEIEIVKNYLKIINIIYDEILKVNISIDSGLLDYIVPTMTLQPLVENAVKHGLNQKLHAKADDCVIGITVYRKGDLYIEIYDNGIGLQENKINKESQQIGIHNITRRIKEKFGEQYNVSFESQLNQYTNVIINLP